MKGLLDNGYATTGLNRCVERVLLYYYLCTDPSVIAS